MIAIIGILISMLLPAVSSVREAGHKTQCVNNLRQFGVALIAYHDDFAAFPVGNFAPPNYPYSFAGGWWGFRSPPFALLGGQEHLGLLQLQLSGRLL